MDANQAIDQLHDMAVNGYPDDVEAVAVVRQEIQRLTAELAQCRRDYRTYVDCVRTAEQAEIERLTAELAAMRRERDRIAKDHDKQMRAAQAAAHVIIETSVVPGVDSPCRCDECRYVARELDDIGYLEDVADTDRWWIQPKEGKSDG